MPLGLYPPNFSYNYLYNLQKFNKNIISYILWGLMLIGLYIKLKEFSPKSVFNPISSKESLSQTIISPKTPIVLKSIKSMDKISYHSSTPVTQQLEKSDLNPKDES